MTDLIFRLSSPLYRKKLIRFSVVGGDGRADFTPEPARRFTEMAQPNNFEVQSAKLTSLMAKELKSGSTGSREKEKIPSRFSAPPRHQPPARRTLNNPIRNLVEESKIHSEPQYGAKKDESPRVAELRVTPR